MRTNRSFKVIDNQGETEYHFERSKAKALLNLFFKIFTFGLLRIQNPYKMVGPKNKKAAAPTEEIGVQRPKNPA